MKIKIKAILFFGISLISFTSVAQSFKWLGTYGLSPRINVSSAVSGTVKKTAVFIVGIAQHTVLDTITYGKFKLPIAANKKAIHLVEVDSMDKVIRAINIGSPTGLTGMNHDSKGNLYLVGGSDTSDKTVFGQNLDIKNGSAWVAKLDSSWQLQWLKQMGGITPYGYPKLHVSGNNKMYFILPSKLTSKIGDSTYVLGNDISTIYGEINTSTGKPIWSNIFYKNDTTSKGNIPSIVLTGIVLLGQNLFLSGNFSSRIKSGKVGNDTLIVKKDTFYSSSGLILKCDSMGNYQKKFSFKVHNNRHYVNVSSITQDDEFIYIGGNFDDSLKWADSLHTIKYKGKGSIKPKENLIVASVTKDLEPRWFYQPTIINNIFTYGTNSMNNLYTKNGYIYGAALYCFPLEINNEVLLSNPKMMWAPLFFKMDYLGNVLWAANGSKGKEPKGGTILSVSGTDKAVYACGYFIDSISFDTFKAKASGKYDAWVTRISDFSINRGKVSSGPYCAGDTIIVPFTENGDFAKSNHFIAQLSDEHGNFEKDYVELGRIKSQVNGTIKGIIPWTKTPSSKNYRIRILSTDPVVQSYYVRDSLRLLIYSRDKADPGPTETLCYGDSILLNTYGGTKWTWTPKYNMADSTKRQTKVWPEKTTNYKIIIADSSGCGAPDTAYKKIIVKQPLKIVLAFNDTSFCGNSTLKVPYHFTGGDSVNYKFQWYFLASPKNWFPTKKGQNRLYDTLIYTPTDPIENLAIVLTDNCTNKPDTAYLILKLKNISVIKTQFKDTLLCAGHVIKYNVSMAGGISKYPQYQWKDILTNTVLSTSDSLKITTANTLKIQLIANDGCENLGDTALFNVTVKQPLKATSNLRDTTICYGKKINYTATGQGGDSKAYKFMWLINNKLIDTTSTLTSVLTSTSTISLILKDNCSLPNDTIKKTISVKPSPKADFTWDLACSKTITKFQFTGSTPQSPIQTSFRWNFNNEVISSLENPSHIFSTTGTKALTLILASDNGCTDTMKKSIDIKPQSKADFTANDVCETDSAVFINKSKDATSYNWRFGDGLKSTIESPRHLYKIGGVTKTFNVSLVAVVANGCSDSIIKAVSINANPNSNFTSTLTGSKVDLKATVQGNTNYLWKFGSTDSAATTNGNYTFNLTKPEHYKVCLKVTNLAGCTSQTCKDLTVGIYTMSKTSGLKIYPNPNTGNFTVEIENSVKGASIEVYDLVGELVKKVERVEKVTLIDLDVDSGIYVVRVKNNGIAYNMKVNISK